MAMRMSLFFKWPIRVPQLSVERRVGVEVSESLGDGDENQVRDEQEVRCDNDALQVAALVAEVHEHQHDVGGLDQSHHDEGPLDGGPCEGFRTLEDDAHAHFHSGDEGQKRSH